MVTTRKNKCNGILSTRILKVKQMKQEVLVKLAGSTVYNKRINIDPNNLTNILKFPKEVFADIDGIRIAIKRDDFEQLIKKNEKIKQRRKN
jgi:hypothetical protein